MRRNLITGGAGFIGSHLAEDLIARGEHVTVLDDLSTGSLDNLRDHRDSPNLRVIVDSVLNPDSVERLVEEADRVFHLAAAVGVDLIVREPARVITTNILGTEHVLRACARSLTPVLVASTSEVYGKSDQVPFREDADLVLGPTCKSRWSYACSKAIDEFMALAYAASRDLRVVITRFFNTTGPRQTGQYGMVVPRFVSQALAGEPITVYGSGEQCRCFCHVRDIVPAAVALLENSAAQAQVVNLGSQEQVSINTLAERVRGLTGSASEIVHIPFEEAYAEGFEDIAARQPDTGKAEALIGFRVHHSLEDILRDVIAWQRGLV